MSNKTELVSYYLCTHVTPECPIAATTYGYYPSFGGNLFFLILFGALIIPALVLGIRSRIWLYTVALCVGLGLEMAGYVARILMHHNPWDHPAFEVQIIGIIIGPVFLAAAIYLTLKQMVIHWGQQHSVLKAKLYPLIFVGCDIGSLVLQAIGGGIAAVSGNEHNMALLKKGNGMIIAGIAFQVFTMSIFGILASIFAFRYWKARGERPIVPSEKQNDPWIFCYAIAIAYTAILIRCIYRIPEMAGGWGGPLMRNEKEFMILDSSMIAIATICLTVFHPGIFFPEMKGKGAH